MPLSHADVLCPYHPSARLSLLGESGHGRFYHPHVVFSEPLVQRDKFRIGFLEERVEVHIFFHEFIEFGLFLHGQSCANCGEQVAIGIRLGHDQSVGWRDQDQCFDVFGKFRRVERCQESAPRVPDQDQLVISQYPADALDVRDLRAQSQ